MNNECEIAVTGTVIRGGVGIFNDFECTAVIEYDTEFGDLDWEIREFIFTEYTAGSRATRKIDRSVTIARGDILFNIIKEGIDMKWLDERVAEEARLPAFDEEREWGVQHYGGSGVL